MIVANFASVPAGSICRPVSKWAGDNYFYITKERWMHMELKWTEWSSKWQVDVRATKRAKRGK